MYTRHDEVPVFEYRDGVINAIHYNTVQTAFKRLGDEIRLEIPRLKTLDLILQHDAWIVVDHALNDIPIVAWTNFDVERRNALHTPVHCQLRLFHMNGGIILKRVLEAMELLLGERLSDLESSHSVIRFPAPE
ncbi:MAG: hypothetical protein OEZ16_13240 [Chromatiales bacterium]|nr:hypothetical protein [Chromatiales bacterium]